MTQKTEDQKILHLTLKKKWFDMILSGEKKEEYRDINNYWMPRLIEFKVAEEFKGEHNVDLENMFYDRINFSWAEIFKSYYAKTKTFDVIKFKNGYSKNAREMTVECSGVSIGEGNSQWGGGNESFVIAIGKILETKNL